MVLMTDTGYDPQLRAKIAARIAIQTPLNVGIIKSVSVGKIDKRGVYGELSISSLTSIPILREKNNLDLSIEMCKLYGSSGIGLDGLSYGVGFNLFEVNLSYKLPNELIIEFGMNIGIGSSFALCPDKVTTKKSFGLGFSYGFAWDEHD